MSRGVNLGKKHRKTYQRSMYTELDPTCWLSLDRQVGPCVQVEEERMIKLFCPIIPTARTYQASA